MTNRRLMIGAMVTSLALLILGFLYEDPLMQRGILLAILSVVFVAALSGVCIACIKSYHRVAIPGVFFSVIVIIAIENLSRFAMNYFYHMLYLIVGFVLIWMVDNLSRRVKYVVIILVYIASLVKYIPLLTRAATLGNIVSFGFVVIIEGAGILLLLLLKAYGQELVKSRELYRALDHAYEQLEDYSDQLQVMTEREARLSIARDLHDTLGHEMTGLIMQLEMSKCMVNKGHDTVKLLDESLISARGALRQIREIVETLRQDSHKDTKWTMDALEKLLGEYKVRTGRQVYFVNQISEARDAVVDEVIYRVVQEAMTNVAKHSQAEQVTVYLYNRGEGQHKVLCCNIEENGPDYDYIGRRQRDEDGHIQSVDVTSILPGNGLKGMKERVDSLGGTLIYGNRDMNHQRFFIDVEIPCR